MKVLVVDDDKLARKGLISIMDWKKYGFEVVGDVQNGRKALEFLKDNEVDIVFTDISSIMTRWAYADLILNGEPEEYLKNVRPGAMG